MEEATESLVARARSFHVNVVQPQVGSGHGLSNDFCQSCQQLEKRMTDKERKHDARVESTLGFVLVLALVSWSY
jgi:hypothetical protein